MSQRLNFRTIGAVVFAILIAAVTTAPAGQSAAKTVNSGIYTEAQAERGRKTFEGNCTTCHDPGRFTGDDFVNHWSGQPLHAIFEIMSTTMPEDNPGALSLQQYADVLSYFLKLNKYPAGADELMGTAAAMKAVQMEAPKNPKD